MNEWELINLVTRDLTRNPTVVQGPGDDCAVLDLGLPDRWVLAKTDAVVEGVHFTAAAAPERIGHKALGRCLSDVAAMGGVPSSALVTVALAPGFDPGFVQRLYAGMEALARRFEVAIVGGETTTNPDRLLLSVALVGTVEKNRCVLRSGGCPGDALFVTGELGGSLAGKHLDFEPRVAEARWLTEHLRVSAMIDLSDGLAGDLRHLMRASGTGAELLAEAIPISPEAQREGGESASPRGEARSPLTAALTDGEDFELLFAVGGEMAAPLQNAWRERFPHLRLSRIGKLTAQGGLRLCDRFGARLLEAHGYTHFA